MDYRDEYDEGRGGQKRRRSIPGAGGWGDAWSNAGGPIGVNWPVLWRRLGMTIAVIVVFAVFAAIGMIDALIANTDALIKGVADRAKEDIALIEADTSTVVKSLEDQRASLVAIRGAFAEPEVKGG